MARFRATQLLTLNPSVGVVYPDAKQLARVASRNLLVVAKGKKNAHTLKGQMQFKAGEFVELEDVPPKVLWCALEGGEEGESPLTFNAKGEAQGRAKAETGPPPRSTDGATDAA